MITFSIKFITYYDSTLVFHLLLKEHVVGGGKLQRVSEIARDDDVHYVDLLDIHSVLIEAHVQVIL